MKFESSEMIHFGLPRRLKNRRKISM